MAGIISAFIATIVTLIVGFVLAPGSHRHPPVFVITSSIIMTCAGWLYVSFRFRFAAMLHAAFMFVVGGYLLFLGLSVLLGSQDWADNAAAGIIAGANLAVTAIGALTFGSGLVLVYHLFRAHKKREHDDVA